MKPFKPYVPNQTYLLPPSPKDWLPPDHLAHFIDDVVDQLDLSAILRAHEGQNRGQPPYHPSMAFAVTHADRHPLSPQKGRTPGAPGFASR